MDEMPGGEWFQYATTFRELMRAVIQVFDEFDDAKQKPGSEAWLVHDQFFAEVRPRVLSRWAQATGLDPRKFPFSDSCIKTAWLTFRKDSVGGIRRWAFGVAGGPDLFAGVA